MSGERFETGDTQESYESPFQQISDRELAHIRPKYNYQRPALRSFTEIGEGEFSLSETH